MFTSQPNVTGLAHILTGHMITRFITEYYIRTLLFAACKMLFNEIKTIKIHSHRCFLKRRIRSYYLSHSIPRGMDLCKFRLASLCYICTFRFAHHTMNYYSIGIHFHNRLHTNRVHILSRN